MSNIKSVLLAEAQELQTETIALRRKIHMHPELGLDLPVTKQTVLDAIGDLDLELDFSERTTGIMATLRGAQDGPTILLRGDMDALPMPEDTGLEFSSKVENCMHSCGHDTHTAMLASAARLLHKHRSELNGNVKFMFQPGEEGFAGARIMLEEGLLEAGKSPEAAFAIHVQPDAPLGTILSRGGPLLAAADTIKVTVHGRGGHGSMPHASLDPVPIACEIVQAFQTFVTRRFSPFDPVVLTVGHIRGGTASNIIPEIAVLEATLRTTNPETREKAKAGARKIAENIAAAHDARAEVKIWDGYPPTLNDDEFVKFVETTTKGLLGDDAWQEMANPKMGAEDFSFVLQKIPGAMVFLGVGPDSEEAWSAPTCHSNHMHVHEEALAHGVALHAAVVFDYLAQNG